MTEVGAKDTETLSPITYPITGSVWFRESTQEWVLELQGTINGCDFTNRHTEPRKTKPEDVAGLPSLYRSLKTGEQQT